MKLFGWNISRKDSAARALTAVHLTGRAVGTPINYDNLANEGFQKNMVVYACVQKIAEAVASIPWLLYSGVGKRKREVEDHPLLRLLDRPNPLQNGTEFMEAVAAYRLISGNSYVQGIAISGSPGYRELFTLRPDRMKVVPGPRGYPNGYEYTVNSSKLFLPVDPATLQSDVLHMKSFHPRNDWYGMGPIEAAMLGIDQHNYAGMFNLALLQNSAMPSGAFVVGQSAANPKGTLNDEQYKRLKETLDNRMAGASNAGSRLILEGGLDWKQLSLSKADMQWIESKNTSARDIALVFGVPGMLLGIPGDNTFNNYREANQAFYLQTVIPLAKNITAWLNRWLVPTFGEKLQLDIDLDQLDALAPSRELLWTQTQGADFLKINEKRERLGYEPVEGGDTLFVSTSLVPLDFAIDPSTGATTDPAPVDNVDPNDSNQDQSKSINLTGRSRAMHWLKNDRARMAFERKMARQASALFQSEAKVVIDAVDGLDPEVAEIAASDEVDAAMGRWKMLLTSNFRAIGNSFGPKTIDGLKLDAGSFEIKSANDNFSKFFNDWVNEKVGNLVRDIAKTSKRRVIDAIRDHVIDARESGDGVVPLSKRIETLYDGFSRSRSTTIARTETVGAMNAASEKAAISTGITGLSKEWISSPADGREREEHQAVDGNTVGLEEKFQVMGEEIARPGDPDASAENRINCRCTIGFVRKGDE